ncbi:MAG: MarR family transcriptional regulator [Methanobacteriota archaeon]|nr:MAG: MarR family transcriptional regulator [Euryarchaeota archaeon]
MDAITDNIAAALPTPSLESVLTSPARFKAARLISRLPEKEFTGRELARHLGVSHSTVQDVMTTLVDKGVVTQRWVGRACVFRANRDSALLEALTRVFKTEAWINETLVQTLRNALQKTGSAGIVFGSVARERASSGSDLDLLVVAKNRRGAAEEFSNLEQLMIRRFGLHLDVKIVSPEELKSSDAAYLKAAISEGRAIGPIAGERVKVADKD